MKKVRILVILVLVLVGLGGVARSQTSTDVYGADDPAVDVRAVQDAVDTYDIVYLHGTFDFEDSVVNIKHSVEVLGDGTDAYGEYLTRIEGGGWGARSNHPGSSRRRLPCCGRAAKGNRRLEASRRSVQGTRRGRPSQRSREKDPATLDRVTG